MDESPPVIYGRTTEGEQITLYDSFYYSWKAADFFTPSLAHSILTSHVALFGGHFAPMKDQVFRGCSIRLAGLQSWCARSSFDITHGAGGELVAKTKVRDSQTFTAPVGEVSLCGGLRQLGGGFKLVLEQLRSLAIQPAEPKTLRWLIDQVRHTERLCTLLFGWPTKAEEVSLWPPSTTDGLCDQVKLIYANRPPDQEDQDSRIYLVKFESVADQLGSLFGNWFAGDEKTDHAMNLYFSTLYQPGDFLETRFLPTVQALEVFARDTYSDNYVSDEDFKAVRDLTMSSIPSTVDAGLKESILARLQFANELTLKHRLKKLIARLEESTQQLFCCDPVKFVKGLVDTRNFHTHYSSEGKVLRKMEMHWATRKMQVLMTVLLLRRAGLSEDLIRRSFLANGTFVQERRVWSQVSETGSKRKDG